MTVQQRLREGVSLRTVAGAILTTYAQDDVLYTVTGEGKAKAIVLSADEEGLGELKHFTMAFEGHHLNDPRFLNDARTSALFNQEKPVWEVLPNEENVDPNLYDLRSDFEKSLGVHFVGIPPWRNVLTYDFEWNETRTVQNNTDRAGTEEIMPRKAITNFIYVKDFPYSTIINNVQTRDLITVNALVTITVRINNPYLALFGTEDWLKQVLAAVDRKARDYMGVNTYYDLRSESAQGLSEEEKAQRAAAGTPETVSGAGPLLTATREEEIHSFSTPIMMLNTRRFDEPDPAKPRGFKGTYGVTILGVDLRWIKRADDADGKIAEAMTAPWIAQQHAKATVITAGATKQAAITTAEGESEATKLLGQAEAKSLESRVEVLTKNGQMGALLAQLDALVSSSKNPGSMTIWAQNPLLQQYSPGLGDLLKGAGVNTVDDLRTFIETRVIAGAQPAPAPSTTPGDAS